MHHLDGPGNEVQLRDRPCIEAVRHRLHQACHRCEQPRHHVGNPGHKVGHAEELWQVQFFRLAMKPAHGEVLSGQTVRLRPWDNAGVKTPYLVYHGILAYKR